MKKEEEYKLSIHDVNGSVQVKINGTIVVKSQNVKVMDETYLPSQYYFPKNDIIEKFLVPSEFRTFCPFKGTAHYWHLQIENNVIENVAWSYEKPLYEASKIPGYVAFSPSEKTEISFEKKQRDKKSKNVADSPLIHWLLYEAWLCKTPSDLTEQFANKLMNIGIPVWRISINLWALHPELAGQQFNWKREGQSVIEYDTPYGALKNPSYLNSPVYLVSEGLGGIRQRLDDSQPEFKFPILEELRAAGGTDYTAMPLPFSDGKFQTLTIATDHPKGFSTADLGHIFSAVISLGRFYEVLTLKRNSSALFGAYLGKRTAKQVLEGRTHRGDGENIKAAILFCDLRDSSSLQELMSREEYLDLLNEFFEHSTEPVIEVGGEVLKFIGDAVLAIFPIEENGSNIEMVSSTCIKARETAEQIVSRISEMAHRTNKLNINCAIGLHFGEIMYGNVGSKNRLDFTATGSAVNIAARLSGECKKLQQSFLLSSEIAQHTPKNLRSLGTKKLHNIAKTIEVFAVSGAEFG